MANIKETNLIYDRKCDVPQCGPCEDLIIILENPALTLDGCGMIIAEITGEAFCNTNGDWELPIEYDLDLFVDGYTKLKGCDIKSACCKDCRARYAEILIEKLKLTLPVDTVLTCDEVAECILANLNTDPATPLFDKIKEIILDCLPTDPDTVLTCADVVACIAADLTLADDGDDTTVSVLCPFIKACVGSDSFIFDVTTGVGSHTDLAGNAVPFASVSGDTGNLINPGANGGADFSLEDLCNALQGKFLAPDGTPFVFTADTVNNTFTYQLTCAQLTSCLPGCVVIPDTEFADPASPTSAEVEAWLATQNLPTGTVIKFIGTGTDEEPQMVWRVCNGATFDVVLLDTLPTAPGCECRLLPGGSVPGTYDLTAVGGSVAPCDMVLVDPNAQAAVSKVDMSQFAGCFGATGGGFTCANLVDWINCLKAEKGLTNCSYTVNVLGGLQFTSFPACVKGIFDGVNLIPLPGGTACGTDITTLAAAMNANGAATIMGAVSPSGLSDLVIAGSPNSIVGLVLENPVDANDTDYIPVTLIPNSCTGTPSQVWIDFCNCVNQCIGIGQGLTRDGTGNIIVDLDCTLRFVGNKIGLNNTGNPSVSLVTRDADGCITDCDLGCGEGVFGDQTDVLYKLNPFPKAVPYLGLINVPIDTGAVAPDFATPNYDIYSITGSFPDMPNPTTFMGYQLPSCLKYVSCGGVGTWLSTATQNFTESGHISTVGQVQINGGSIIAVNDTRTFDDGVGVANNNAHNNNILGLVGKSIPLNQNAPQTVEYALNLFITNTLTPRVNFIRRRLSWLGIEYRIVRT